MIDPNTIAATLAAGAAALGPKIGEIAGTEVVKEVTKDAYKALKERLVEICGRRAQRALDRIEVEPASDEAWEQLVGAVSQIEDDDVGEVEDRQRALLVALLDDPAARTAAEAVASIKLDVESDGKVTIHSLRGARSIDVRSRSKQDFTFSNVDMDGGSSGGN